MLLGQHYNTRSKLPSMLRGGWSAKPPPPPSTNLLSLYQELGPNRYFPLAAGAGSPSSAQDLHNFHMQSLNLTTNHSIVIYISRRCRWTPCLPHSGKDSRSYDCLNLRNPGSHSQATVVQGTVPGQRPTQSAISPERSRMGTP